MPFTDRKAWLNTPSLGHIAPLPHGPIAQEAAVQAPKSTVEEFPQPSLAPFWSMNDCSAAEPPPGKL